ncbi:hypothetical protein [Streptacidiphilus sp. P02-A3a]|uniref:hypothetical protein n=1 Tax=Streptacidiphilus sp. P02-A3a TaxID=2704468 RepID=UPI0015FE4B4C|nr:hypothetical protein [Streptacidiphilus sp. P02-A3a]QMU71801.1 hypothetical protein GXP74_29735 [Streptacidiphilus sp. P02-A3a]
MNTTDPVQLGKQPASLLGATADHPAGEIRLRSSGRLGLRSQLLRGPSAPRDGGPYTSVTMR